MENTDQDSTIGSTTGGTAQTPDDSILINQDYNPADLAGDVNSPPTTPTDEEDAATETDGSGAASGSPNMEVDKSNYGNGDTLGNNDGTEVDPELTDITRNS